jgi:GNAT superfamily N-acetyltransferase
MEGTKHDIQVRMALPDDCAQLVSVLAESFVEYESFYTPGAYSATIPTQDKVQSRLNEGPTWVALRNEAVVGTVSAVPKGDALYVRGMAVLPAARGLGIGEILLIHVESYASAHGYKRLTLSTTPFFSHAIHLYENFGFRRSNEGPQDLFGTPLFMMSKTLERAD